MQDILERLKPIAEAIADLIREGESGYTDGQNATGDTQLKLDIASDRLIEASLRELSGIRALISEEKEAALVLDAHAPYTVCYDPLDGSSIVDADLTVGSIFGIYEGEPSGETLVASAYILYGHHIELITLIRGEQPVRSRHLRSGWEVLSTPYGLGARGKHVAPGGTQRDWPAHHRAYIEGLFAQGYRLRYSGGMVPDLHHLLVKGGGIFSYPATADVPEGKLRVLFEVLPFALIFEAAGGQAIDHRGRRLLEITPRHPHDTTPCFFGSDTEIDALKEAYGVA